MSNNDFSEINRQENAMPPPSPENNLEENIPMLKPNTWLWQSIAVIMCCFPLFGIIALINGLQVNSYFYAGFYEKAERASKRARLWALLGLITGIVYSIFMMITLQNIEFLEEILRQVSDGKFSIYNY